MREPYLLLGVRFPDAALAQQPSFAALMADLERALLPAQLTALKVPGVWVAELTPASAFAKWQKVSRLLSEFDARVDDELEWFVHLADREGCELAYN